MERLVIPEPHERTVRIPVQWIDGQWQLIGGGKLPEFRQNVCAELFMSAAGLTDEDERNQWTADEQVELLDTGTELFAQVNRNGVPLDLRRHLVEKQHNTGHPSAFVKVTLTSGLMLSLTPGKKGALSAGSCEIPSLNEHADSVNQALTKISRAYEPARKSFGGSVFQKMWVEHKGQFITLGELRENTKSLAASESALPSDSCQSSSVFPGGRDPRLAVAAAKLAVKVMRAGILNFAAFIESASTHLSRDEIQELAPYLEMVWRSAGEIANVDLPGDTMAVLRLIESRNQGER
jgi:hypothetical protein